LSKTKSQSAYYSIHEFMKKQKHTGVMSHATFADRTQRLKVMFRQLHQWGYESTHVGRIKQKHVALLVKHWQSTGDSVGTIKNRLSDLRFVCRTLKRTGVIKSNADYRMGHRCYVPTTNKALHSVDFSSITDPHLRCSLELQRLFGLRREECLKIMPHRADEGALLRLQSTWTKGGIERCIPIRTQEQRHWLDQAKILVAKKQSLIPQGVSYIVQRRKYDRITHQAGFKNLHGLRHAYAQQRYAQLTGGQAPIAGGTPRTDLSDKKRRLDQRARKIVALELGHRRPAIVKNYCG
jgi:site-specific recombinase XerC